MAGNDAELLAHAVRLLALPPPALDEMTTASLDPRPPADVRIGRAELAIGDWVDRYRLLSILGVGGFGEVYLAEQLDPIARRVALKVVKHSADSRSVIARFEQERQALAIMDHPGVAKVFDAGTTASGRPYFVMEYVAGLPITEFCDRERLDIRQRISLFEQVCDAVQHAHHKGIIHRDLKPSNILVSLRDNKPAPVVIDFGVAKATTRALTEQAVFEESGLMIGTPEYMSPEQADPGRLDIDTRTDVYSLGVVLYELLAGVAPFDGRLLRRAGYAEIQRLIREMQPPRPSTRLSELGEEAQRIAERRQTRTSDLTRILFKELEWIPLMAMRKDRTRRYQSPRAIADDLQRYLRGEPLAAGPESRSYRARKFIARHRVIVGGAGAAAMIVLSAAAVAAAFWATAVAERRVAVTVTAFLLEDMLRESA
ncbi:MAG: serine/threonine-protein kinase [Planctomycetota bacterium]|nr:serine/threonine-protein kinase [Planctomycetota bacterium]